MRNSKQARSLVTAVTLMGAMALPTAAWSYGVEIPENGAVAFGRGGAFVTRASDPSAVMHNVAGIMGLPGLQVMISSNVGSFSHCFQRSGTYDGPGVNVEAGGTVFLPAGMTGPGAYAANGTTPYPQVCKNPSVALAPLVLGTYRINRFIGIGFGVYAPSTQGSRQEFDDRVTATTPMGMSVLAPTPARNLLYQKALTVLHPVIAVSVQPLRWLRFGLGIEPSFASFEFGLNVNGVAIQAQAPSSDVRIVLNASGFFMAGSFSMQALPTPWLSFGAQIHYNFPIDASGTGSGTGSLYARNSADVVASSFQINSMRVNLPLTVRAGVRYNMPIAGHPTQDDGTGRYDPMSDDVFDVEATFNYERTSMLSRTELDNTGTIRVDSVISAMAPPSIAIESALSDVMGIRVGGDWNILPGRLAARIGGSYETAGVSPDLAQIHLPAYAGGSVHAGLSYRWRWLTISAGYGHFFFQDNNATSARRAVTVPSPQIDLASCPTGQQGPGTCTINRGVYSSSFDAGSLALTARW